MKRKPYSKPSDCDSFYVDVQRDLFGMLGTITVRNCVLTTEQKAELSYRLVSYFEDVVNEIGIWNALRKWHLKLYGKKNPLIAIDEEEYNDHEINPEDIQFIIYTSLVTFFNESDELKTFISPVSQNLLLLSEDIFAYLASYEEIYVNDFYKNYFTVTDDSDYFDFKYKLSWFGLAGYLTGYELNSESLSLLKKYSGNRNDYDHGITGRVAYEINEQLIRTYQTRWSALTPLDIMTELIQCSESKREEIRNLKYKHEGTYHLQNQDARYYYFYNTGTEKEYPVLKDSVEGKGLSGEMSEYYRCGFVKWNNEFWLSGILFNMNPTPDELRIQNLKNQNVFYKYDKDFRALLDKSFTEYHDALMEYFQQQLISYSDGKQMEDDINQFHQWQFDNKVIKENLREDVHPVVFHLPEFIKESNDAAIFIPEKNNFELINGHSFLVDSFSKTENEFSQNNAEELMMMINDDELSREYMEYIFANYGSSSFEMVYRTRIRNERDFSFLMRLYSPMRFMELEAPRLTVFNSEKNPETMEAYLKTINTD